MAHRNGSHSDLYEKVGRLEGQVIEGFAGLNAKLDRFLVVYDQHVRTEEDRIGVLEERVSKNTQDISRAKGIAGVIAATVSVGASFAKDLFVPRT